MKRIVLAFTFILSAVTLVSAQNKEASIVAVDSVVHDFGEVNEADEPVVHIFKVKNDGNAPLIITKVAASCGCTTPEWTKEPIAPGKTGEIKVSFDTRNRPGLFTKTIAVYSNGKVGNYTLTIKGKVKPKSEQK
jgi:LEA14-like dessication related protein